MIERNISLVRPPDLTASVLRLKNIEKALKRVVRWLKTNDNTKYILSWNEWYHFRKTIRGYKDKRVACRNVRVRKRTSLNRGRIFMHMRVYVIYIYIRAYIYIYVTYIFCTEYFSFSSYKLVLSVFYDDSTKFYRQHTIIFGRCSTILSYFSSISSFFLRT